jgi:primosomal protein N' (replication factor Y) (superfamily II helicase)
MTYLEIIVNVARVKDVFHYHLPQNLEGKVKVGNLVTVQFGHQTVQGVVVGFVEQPSVDETRPVLELIDENAVLTEDQIILARRLAEDTLSSLADCIALMMPPGLEQRADLIYTLVNIYPQDLTSTQKRILSLLEKRGSLTGRQFDHSMKHVNWRTSMNSLIRKGIVSKEQVLPEPKVRPKYIRKVHLICEREKANKLLPSLGRVGSQALKRRQEMVKYLLGYSELVPVSDLYEKFGGNIQDLRLLEEYQILSIEEYEVYRDPVSSIEIEPYHAPKLTREQEEVWKEIQVSLEEALKGIRVPPILLHGVTGSGKTEIYLHAVKKVLDSGKQAIILVPEIALTPQTIRRFAGRFPNKVGIFHSELSSGERYDTWRRAREGEFELVIGPRSALFTPLEKIGLIVIDECHDDSYHQSEGSPYYHAREVAVEYANQIGALCMLGSATPDAVSYYKARNQEWNLLSLPKRILAHKDLVQAQIQVLQKINKSSTSVYQSLEGNVAVTDLPEVSIVDMRQELKSGNRSIFSRDLQESLKKTIDQELQAILFLNRRGSATYVFCRDCGHELKCPQCDIPLTYHQQSGILLCHYCNYKRKMPSTCPNCGSERIRHYGTGTQKVELEVQTLFTKARTLRWDHETTRKKGSHDRILSQFINQEANVLIGTQMLAKGLDLPLVTLVGVILADVGLNMPDYRANERAFQILTQVAGRAGRSPLGGKVIFQTFKPDHYVIKTASLHDYHSFYEEEISFRRKLKYPPFSKIVRLEFRHYNQNKAEDSALSLAKQLQNWILEDNRRSTRIIGPAPCFFSRIGGVYRWQIVLVGPDPIQILRGRKIDGWKIEVYPPNLL